jgi:3-deoxy-D-manno-octulosonic acid kinase
MLVRRGLEGEAERLGLRGDPPSAETVAGGRARHPVVALPDGGRAVVRRFRRGGAVRHLNRATYFGGHRAFDELRATERARGGGVRVPDVLAATERRGAVGYAAWLATRLIPGATESAAWLRGASTDARRAFFAETGRQIARMHAAGVAHPDLNLRNLLVVASGDDASAGDAGGIVVWVIDFDRARLFDGPVPAERREADVARLERSANKLRLPLTDAERAILHDSTT